MTIHIKVENIPKLKTEDPLGICPLRLENTGTDKIPAYIFITTFLTGVFICLNSYVFDSNQ